MNTRTKYPQGPYETIPEELLDDYTLNGQIPVLSWYLDDRKTNGVEWNNEYINGFIKRFTPKNITNNLEGRSSYGNEVCLNLLKSFQDYGIYNKNVAVIGSETPWIEAILINMTNKVTTIEYNVPNAIYENLECKDYFNYFENNKDTFDAIITFSSIEHSGLGRYGDPLDPNGDIKTMDSMYNNLIDGGTLIWGAPVGKDALTWNAHRIYGPMRLPIMFDKFEELNWYGYSKEILFSQPLRKDSYQPVVVLKKTLPHRKEEAKKKQDYLKKVYTEFLKKKGEFSDCKYNPPTCKSCIASCKNPICPGFLNKEEKYEKK